MRSEKKRSLVLLKSAAQEKQPAPQMISVPAHSALGNWQLAPLSNWPAVQAVPFRKHSTKRTHAALSHRHTAAPSHRCPRLVATATISRLSHANRLLTIGTNRHNRNRLTDQLRSRMNVFLSRLRKLLKLTAPSDVFRPALNLSQHRLGNF